MANRPTQTNLKLSGAGALQRDFDRILGATSPAKIRGALVPAAKVFRRSIRSEAPVGETRMLRNSVVVRKSRRAPVVMVAVDRKKALRVSPAFPKGFPYVNSVISTKRRGALADKFVDRGFDAAEAAAGDEAEEGLAKLIDQALGL